MNRTMCLYFAGIFAIQTAICAAQHENTQNPVPSLIDDTSANRIIGGQYEAITNFSHLVSIHLNGQYICCGSIINPKKILTAAHCLVGQPSRNITIRVGSSLTNYGGELLAIAKIHIHNNYSTSSIYDNDIAVIVLKQNLKLNGTKTVQNKIELQPAHEKVQEGAVGVVSGWGQDHPAGPHSIWLRAVSLTVISKVACSQIYGTIVTDNMLCAEYMYGRPGYGDGGAPFIVRGKLVGITSWGAIGWEVPFLPIVFISVNPYIDWIAHIK